MFQLYFCKCCVRIIMTSIATVSCPSFLVQRILVSSVNERMDDVGGLNYVIGHKKKAEF